MSAQARPIEATPSHTAASSGGAPQPTLDLAATEPQLTNRASLSKSPFVRSHADSPVAWHLFDDEAVSKAKRENKLIFLSVGYSACHYCHLTRQDSFSNPKVSSLLNEHFVPVLLDREVRPDIDAIYMSYIHSLNSAAGWPLNVFLTPELEPVFGGTYWPGPGVQHRTISGETGEDELEEVADFLSILQKMQSVWPEQEARVREEAIHSLAKLREYSGEGTLNKTTTAPQAAAEATTHTHVESTLSGEVDLDQLEEAYNWISRTFDPQFGGFGNQAGPKFYTPTKLSLLLRATRFPSTVVDIVGDDDSVQLTRMALHTLRRMMAGGVHDHLGAGFHRNSVTRDWSLPSFEKMLADNALLLGLYLDAALLVNTGSEFDNEFSPVVFELADYITTAPITLEHGGFATSEAADGLSRWQGKNIREGAYYLWRRKELDSIIEDDQKSRIAATYWDVKEHGNVDPGEDPNDEFLNQNVLRVVGDTAELAKQNGVSEDEIKRLVASAKAKLAAHREKERPRPKVDQKVVTAYNGMAIASLARTAAAVSTFGKEAKEKGAKYLEAARKAAAFIKKELWDGKGLSRFYSEGQRSDTQAFAEDYAFLIDGLIELYEATAEEEWLKWAFELQAVQTSLFYDSPALSTATPSSARCGAFYTTPANAPHVLLRLKDAMDTSQPSTNAVSVSNLFRLAGLHSDSAEGARLTHQAKETINAFEPEMLQYPYLFPGLLVGVVSWKLGSDNLRYVGNGTVKEQDAAETSTEQTKALSEIRRRPRGNIHALKHVALGGGADTTGLVPGLQQLVEGSWTNIVQRVGESVQQLAERLGRRVSVPVDTAEHNA